MPYVGRDTLLLRQSHSARDLSLARSGPSITDTVPQRRATANAVHRVSGPETL